MSHEIFISYSRRDKEVVMPFVRQIQNIRGRLLVAYEEDRKLLKSTYGIKTCSHLFPIGS